MSDLDHEAGGIRCREVLEHLSAYMDGELTEDEVRRVEAHLAECDRCERFGGSFGEAVTALRRELHGAGALDADVAGRLRRRLAEI